MKYGLLVGFGLVVMSLGCGDNQQEKTASGFLGSVVLAQEDLSSLEEIKKAAEEKRDEIKAIHDEMVKLKKEIDDMADYVNANQVTPPDDDGEPENVDDNVEEEDVVDDPPPVIVENQNDEEGDTVTNLKESIVRLEEEMLNVNQRLIIMDSMFADVLKLKDKQVSLSVSMKHCRDKQDTMEEAFISLIDNCQEEYCRLDDNIQKQDHMEKTLTLMIDACNKEFSCARKNTKRHEEKINSVSKDVENIKCYLREPQCPDTP